MRDLVATGIGVELVTAPLYLASVLPGLEPQEDPVHTWRVGELGAHLERLLAGAFPGDVWVEGQIRDLSRPASGHVFFQLAEPTPHGQPPTAAVPVVLRRPEKAFVNNLLKRSGGAVRMDDGIEVRIKARVRWYRPRGVLQLQMLSIDPAFTLGRLAADRERTLAALREDGLLDANGRRPFPAVPLRVGVVTSLGSAAHADFLAELRTSGLGFTVYEADARTQGVDCEPSVVAALAAVSRLDVDVVALVRGGGARTDLTGFDSSVIARAIAAMPVPVLTGIGHEIDRSIADEVAHTAFKTPTAVADHLIDRVLEFRGPGCRGVGGHGAGRRPPPRPRHGPPRRARPPVGRGGEPVARPPAPAVSTRSRRARRSRPAAPSTAIGAGSTGPATS